MSAVPAIASVHVATPVAAPTDHELLSWARDRLRDDVFDRGSASGSGV